MTPQTSTSANVLVSVIIPCYRQAHFLPECIASLQAQTMPDWEAIVVDDGSPDDTAAVAERLSVTDPRVRLLRKPNGGLSSARNAGFNLARGRFIQFLDADDLLEPRKLEVHSRLLRDHSDIGLVYGNAWYFPDGNPAKLSRGGYLGRTDEDWITELALDRRSVIHKLSSVNMFPVCAPLVRRTALSGYSFDETLRALEDWHLWLQLAVGKCQFKFVDQPMANALIRVHGTSMSHDSERMLEARYELFIRAIGALPHGLPTNLAAVALASAIAGLDAARRNERFMRAISVAPTTATALALNLARLAAPGSPARFFLKPWIRLLPWRLGAASLAQEQPPR